MTINYDDALDDLDVGIELISSEKELLELMDYIEEPDIVWELLMEDTRQKLLAIIPDIKTKPYVIRARGYKPPVVEFDREFKITIGPAPASGQDEA
ncbi:hypothetical protein [Desulfovibrio ferrophilus]|uniref:Uncharacterized protein n=1 Tax=Desulfovibrio ferrophilus TaxID=241368 RepID=A0A2Z6B3M1_9BACT|nr:hypothetical protein [Desulfovibrio ferrophilus]BBD10124.1 uncharacterized protein DFE_A0023 [Desulfovibrio ferrophilus]